MLVGDLALLFVLALTTLESPSGEERRHSKKQNKKQTTNKQINKTTQRSALRACDTRTDLEVGKPQSEGVSLGTRAGSEVV